MGAVEIQFHEEAQREPIDLPLSKSIAARALVCEALGRREISDSLLGRLPDCRDTRDLCRALRSVADHGADPVKVDCGEGAATLRFFVAVAAATEGLCVLVDCAEGLRRRPLKTLLDALRTLGADIEGDGCPLLIRGRRLRGGEIELDSSVSSQYASALMMIAPTMAAPLRIRFAGGKVVSAPYLHMTAKVMARYGSGCGFFTDGVAAGRGEGCCPPGVDMEPDWSAAAFFYEYALIRGVGSEVRIRRLVEPSKSLQGDSDCVRLFAEAGVVTRFEADGGATIFCRKRRDSLKDSLSMDLGDTPDLVPSLAVGLCLAGIPFRLRGVGHLIYKECDRSEALRAGLSKFGYHIICGEDVMEWRGERCEPDPEGVIDVYGDHRMAMAFAMAAVGTVSVRLSDPQVVGKSFPAFWREIEKIGLKRI